MRAQSGGRRASICCRSSATFLSPAAFPRGGVRRLHVPQHRQRFVDQTTQGHHLRQQAADRGNRVGTTRTETRFERRCQVFVDGLKTSALVVAAFQHQPRHSPAHVRQAGWITQSFVSFYTLFVQRHRLFELAAGLQDVGNLAHRRRPSRAPRQGARRRVVVLPGGCAGPRRAGRGLAGCRQSCPW